MKKFFFIVFLLSTITFLYSEVTTVTLAPTDDMYTDPDHPGVNPNPSQLWLATFQPAGHFERIMLKFDLEPYRTADLISATLKLTRFFSCPGSGTTVSKFYAIATSWDESSWDHTQHIIYDENITMNYSFSGAGGQAITNFEIEMTDFFQNWFNDSYLSDYGFVIKANPNQKFSKFYSKEFSNEEYRPKLVLELDNLGIEEENLAKEIALKAYPNPFNPSTKINFNLPNSQNISLKIYDINGALVKELVKGYQNSGNYSINWAGDGANGGSISAGMYFAVLKGENFTINQKMVYLK